jgi:hypothetical protein
VRLKGGHVLQVAQQIVEAIAPRRRWEKLHVRVARAHAQAASLRLGFPLRPGSGFGGAADELPAK